MVKTVTEEVFLSAVNFANAFYVLVLQNPDLSFFENHVDSDYLASDKSIQSGSTLFFHSDCKGPMFST